MDRLVNLLWKKRVSKQKQIRYDESPWDPVYKTGLT